MAPTQNGEKVNGTSTVNAINGASPTTPIEIGERLATKTKPKPSPLKIKPATADKQGVANAFERYAQVMHARAKPLPTQAGAGTFYEGKRWGKLRDDIKALRSAGTLTGTVRAQLKEKQRTAWRLMHTRLEDAQDGRLVQDQGRGPDGRQDHDHGMRHPARFQPPQQLKAACRVDQHLPGRALVLSGAPTLAICWRAVSVPAG